MLNRIYILLGGGLLLAYLAASLSGWQMGSPQQQLLPPSVRLIAGRIPIVSLLALWLPRRQMMDFQRMMGQLAAALIFGVIGLALFAVAFLSSWRSSSTCH